MRTALLTPDQHLASPSVGTWFPSVGMGAALAEGMQLGRLRRADTWLAVVVPPEVVGQVVQLIPAGTWVAYGDGLVQVGHPTASPKGAKRSVAAEDAVPDGVVQVRADTEGTVYLRPEPGAPPFVTAFDQVAARAPLALIEVMKTFTTVRAPCAGRVTRVLVNEATPIASQEVLFWLLKG